MLCLSVPVQRFLARLTTLESKGTDQLKMAEHIESKTRYVLNWCKFKREEFTTVNFQDQFEKIYGFVELGTISYYSSFSVDMREQLEIRSGLENLQDIFRGSVNK